MAVQLLREGNFVAEVAIDLHPDAGEWGPAISPADIRKLDRVRVALRAGNVAAAARDARIFRLVPQPEPGFAEEPQKNLKP